MEGIYNKYRFLPGTNRRITKYLRNTGDSLLISLERVDMRREVYSRRGISEAMVEKQTTLR